MIMAVTIPQGKKYCHGDDVTDFSVWFLEHRCELGTVIYRNLITGLQMVTDQVITCPTHQMLNFPTDPPEKE